ncbi:uncharacterized protein PADG_00772 [Paracoccidioides brasiliensis Pb18]|uniref:Uncharacterized protein n=1 Tax=Paracoccidioides brasiliensis (strain Pb18) TaxID=502780 RepID=C1G1N2_PARBD|nr:uncharacterized protein PADG_00772 [Paracoccidioides brasiliensis Pb18]EEH44483.2 hypothetical protein PADG_00772 [Paracoccidioides brasiliensis Pb18]
MSLDTGRNRRKRGFSFSYVSYYPAAQRLTDQRLYQAIFRRSFLVAGDLAAIPESQPFLLVTSIELSKLYFEVPFTLLSQSFSHGFSCRFPPSYQGAGDITTRPKIDGVADWSWVLPALGARGYVRKTCPASSRFTYGLKVHNGLRL